MLSTSCRYELGDGGRASESGRRMADIDCSTGGEQLISKNDTVQGVVSGADLARRDSIPTTQLRPVLTYPHPTLFEDDLTCIYFTLRTSPYRVDLPYIVFPPSDQFLVMVATGWLRVQNVSDSDSVELVAQKRTSSYVGPRPLFLLPGDEKVIPYR